MHFQGRSAGTTLIVTRAWGHMGLLQGTGWAGPAAAGSDVPGLPGLSQTEPRSQRSGHARDGGQAAHDFPALGGIAGDWRSDPRFNATMRVRQLANDQQAPITQLSTLSS